MGSVSSRTGVVALDGTNHGDNSDTVSEYGTGHGSWSSLPVSERRIASAPSKTRNKSPRSRIRAEASNELDRQEMKTDLKRYKKYVQECQNQECIAVTKLQEVEKQLAEVEGVNLRLQDEIQLLEEKVEYLQEAGADSQPHNYVEMLKMKDKYIQNLGKETHVIRAEVTQLKAKYKKKLKEKSAQIAEMRQLHCVQMMEIKTEMEKLMEENENLSDQLSRSEHGHVTDRPADGTNDRPADRRSDVIVELSAKVSEQESRIIALENRLHQREKHLNELLQRSKSLSKKDLGEVGDIRRRRDGGTGTVDRHCQSDALIAEGDKRSSSGTVKHGSDGRLADVRPRTWDEAMHDPKNATKSVGEGISHKYTSNRYVPRNHSYSSTSDVDDDDGCWEDEDLSAGDKRKNGFRTSISAFYAGAADDSPGRHGHHGYSMRKSKNKNHNNEPNAVESPKQRHRHRECNDTTVDVIDPTGDSRHASQSRVNSTA